MPRCSTAKPSCSTPRHHGLPASAKRDARADPAIVFVAFDLLHLDGWDLKGASLRDRKTLLCALLEEQKEPLRYGEHVEERGDVFFREVCRLGLEGIVSKRTDDPYREKRTRSWLKVKCAQRQEFVIVGYTDPAGSRTGFGALLLGVRESRGSALRYAGMDGTGFDELRCGRSRSGSRGSKRAKFPSTPPPRRVRVCTGWTPSSSPRSRSASGPPTDACATRYFTGCARTSRRATSSRSVPRTRSAESKRQPDRRTQPPADRAPPRLLQHERKARARGRRANAPLDRGLRRSSSRARTKYCSPIRASRSSSSRATGKRLRSTRSRTSNGGR